MTLHDAICPVCGEPLDEYGACTACDYAEDEAPEDHLDFSILWQSAPSVAEIGRAAL